MPRPALRWGIALMITLLLFLGVGWWLQPRVPSAPPPVTSSSPTSTVSTPPLVAFERDGMRGQMPDGWQELEPGTYISPEQDATFVVQRLPSVPLVLILPVVLRNIGVDAQPEPHSHRQANAIDWSLYRTTADSKPVDFALGQGSGANYLLLLQSPVGQEDVWYSAVLLPLVDALQPTS